MANLPDPPVPPACTMAGNDWFPLHYKRLRKSKWWRRATDLARARNVMLWGEAYEATPAASLPDDDDELAEAAGFGMDAEAFIAAKDEIMAPWTLCSDGRWYHPTLVEVVLEAWERVSATRKKEAQRKADQRARARGVPPNNGPVPPKSANVPRDPAENTPDKCTHDITGQDRTGQNPPNPPGGDDGTFALAFAVYPQTGRAFTHRDKALGEWLAASETTSPNRLLLAVKAFAASDLAAEEKGKRVPSLQKWLRERRFEAWNSAAPTPAWSGPADVRHAVTVQAGEPFAIGYLDRCTWRDLPDRAVVTTSPTAADRLKREVGELLAGLGVAIVLEAAA